MKILVTGATGFVGTNLVTRLCKLSHEVIATDRISKSHLGIGIVEQDIANIGELVREIRPQVVYHLAGQVAVTESIRDPVVDFRVNALGTLAVVLAANDVGAQVIYLSTNKVYGSMSDVSIIEYETRYDFENFNPFGISEDFGIDDDQHTPYGISKLCGELYVREYGGIVNRCSCIYGPHQRAALGQAWLANLAKNKILDRETIIYGNGKQVRDILHVSDLVELLVRQIGGLPGVYNVGGGYDNTISLLELCDRWKIVSTFAPWRPGDQRVYYSNLRRVKMAFGWEPKVDIDQGLEEFYALCADTYSR